MKAGGPLVAVERIVSGGQTGVDRGALDAALELGIACGGWCPTERRAEDGVIPEHYPLQETASHNYNQRTMLNARDSDATLILNEGELEGGTAYTFEVAKRLGRPCLVIDLMVTDEPDVARQWLGQHGVKVLNVAGPRESKCPGIQQRSHDFLCRLFRP